MRKAHAAAGALAAALLLAGGAASGQSQQPGKYKAQPLILQRQQLGTESFATAGRARMRNGDCAGALDAFDAAIRTSIEPALRRDRGLCHERLGHPYPAIDDYRVYLTAEPDAPDADGIRERLRKLEDETNSGASPSPADESSTGGAEAKTTVTVGVGGAGGAGTTTSASTTTRGKLDYVDRDDDPLRTSLRAGKGWSFGPYLALHKWLIDGTSFGDSQTWAECVGLQVRYSVGPGGALVLEAGYEHFNSTQIDLATVSGLTTQIGYEFRFPFDGDYDNQLLIMPGLGYEHWTKTPTDPSGQSVSLGAFVPRVRVGWRHMLAPNAALDLALDGGVGNFFQYKDFPYDSNSTAAYLIAANVAMVWGM